MFSFAFLLMIPLRNTQANDYKLHNLADSKLVGVSVVCFFVFKKLFKKCEDVFQFEKSTGNLIY